MGEEYAAKEGRRYAGGLEFHHRQPPAYMADRCPSHEKCWLIGGPCWHDGTSLYAHERLIPLWQAAPDDHERMFRILEKEYERQFNEPDAA